MPTQTIPVIVNCAHGEVQPILERGTGFEIGNVQYVIESDVLPTDERDTDVYFHPTHYPSDHMTATLNFLREQGVI